MVGLAIALCAISRLDVTWESAVKGGFVGGAIVVSKERTLFERFTSFAAGDPLAISARSLLPICSVTKLMTADLVLELVDSGALKLDGTVGEYLSWAPQHVRVITIRQLLTHTSGIANMDSAMAKGADGVSKVYFSKDEALGPLRSRVERLVREKLANPPGKKFDYNNTDFLILQAIVEAKTKNGFGRALKLGIFDPNRMTGSGFVEWTKPSFQVVPSYSIEKGKAVVESRFNFGVYGGSGSIISTPDDMAKFIRAELNKSKSKSAIWMGSQFGGFQGFGGYAYETEVFGKKEPIFERPGAIANYGWQVTFLPDRGIAAAVFSNREGIRLGSGFERSGLVVDLLKSTIGN